MHVMGEYTASIKIDDYAVTEGSLPPKALALVVEWASQHKEELMNNWENARQGKNLLKIEPLI